MDSMGRTTAWKTFFSALIGLGIAGGLTTLPVEAGDERLLESSTETEFVFSQIPDYDYNNTEPADTFKTIVGWASLGIGTSIVGYHLLCAYRPSGISSRATLNHDTSLLNRVSPKLRQELLRLVHNQATASRLLAGTRASHPGHSPNWVAEKVIYDLKRDR